MHFNTGWYYRVRRSILVRSRFLYEILSIDNRNVNYHTVLLSQITLYLRHIIDYVYILQENTCDPYVCLYIATPDIHVHLLKYSSYLHDSARLVHYLAYI